MIMTKQAYECHWYDGEIKCKNYFSVKIINLHFVYNIGPIIAMKSFGL